jgi:drug/metabolite transporter (DMT)-like permease
MGTFARSLATHFELAEQTYLRIAAAFLLSGLLFYKHIRWVSLAHILFTASRRDFLILALRATFLYLGVLLFTEALLNANYGNASFIASLPLLPVFGYVFLRERLSFGVCAWIVFGFFGVTLLALPDFSSLLTLDFRYGEILALISLLAFDASYIARRFQSDKLNNYESTFVMLGLGSIFLFCTSLALGESLVEVSDFHSETLLLLGVSGLFNVMNVLLTNFGFQHVKAGIAGNILALETIFALGYSLFLYGESVSSREILGGACVLLSVLGVQYWEGKGARQA